MEEQSSGGNNLVKILHNYEKQLAHLKQELAILQLQNKEYVKTTQTITDENKQLHSEIQDLIEEQMKKLTDSSGQADESTVKNLTAQLKLVQKEKDVAANMNKETLELLDKIRKENACGTLTDHSKNRLFDETKLRVDTLENANLQMQILIETLQEENRTLSNTTSQQIKELKTLVEQERNLKQKLNESYRKQEDDNKKVLSLSHRVDELESMHLNLKIEHDQITVKNKKLHSSLVEAEEKLSQALQSASNSQFQVDDLKIRMVSLEKLNNDIEAKEMDYLMQIRQSAQLLDDALLSRDTALSNAEKSQNDLSKVSSAMETLVQEVADRVKSEVDKAKSQYNQNICRLIDEVELLELENTNLHSETDRVKRVKQSVEEELDAFRHQHSDVRDRMHVDELQRRTIHAERARDDLILTVQKLEERLKRLSLDHSDEKSQLINSNQKLDQRVKKLELESEENRHERFQLLESFNQCKNENQKLEEIAHSARLSAAKEFTLIKESLIKEKKQLEIKLSSIEKSHQTSLCKLKKMLADQQRTAARWKDESKHACEVYEDKVKALQSQLAKSQRKCQELMKKAVTGISNDNALRLEDENRSLRAELHQSHYQTLHLAQKLSNAQSLSNSIGVQDL